MLLPMIMAMLVAISRTIDYHHFYSDIVGGAVLGTGLGICCWLGRKEGIKSVGGGENETLGSGTGYEAVSVV